MGLTTAQPARHLQSTTKALTLAYLMSDRPDLGYTGRFLNDSGLVTMQRGEPTLLLHGTDPASLCYVMHKASKAAFTGFELQVTERAASGTLTKLPGVSTVEPLD